MTAKIRPLIVGVGGTTRPNSSTERAMRFALGVAESLGAETVALGGTDLELPIYDFGQKHRGPNAARLIDAWRRADGIILASPGYHGSMSGMIKNMLDYAEDLREDPFPYFDSRAVGCIATAAGWQATTTTILAMRSVVHALRGWPVPMGATLNTSEPIFDADGNCLSPQVEAQLARVAGQVVQFARMQMAARAAAPSPYFFPTDQPYFFGQGECADVSFHN
jgi:FMN reductase